MWMESSSFCASSISEENSCGSYSYNSEEYIEHEHCMSSCMIETAKSMLLEVLDVSSIREKDDLTGQETGNSPDGIMHALGHQGQSSGPDVISGEGEVANSKEIGTCQEVSQSISVDAKVQKGLRKCSTFPCSAEVQLEEGLPSTEVEDQNPSTTGSSYARSISLPASFKLVSAMKGSRAQTGITPSEILNVKWAAEVYDPPATSMSHTVRNHHHRPKAKKKDNHKHKTSKGKSSRGAGSEKKNVNRGNINATPLDTRNNGLQLKGYARANGQEAKCRISFLNEGLARMHLSIGEAL